MTFEEFKNTYQNKEVVEVPNQVPKNPIVSVCVQTYQQKDFIEDCLEGILRQKTDFEFEILLGEDDSKDGTREICLQYAKKYPDKIRLFLHHRENQIKVLGASTPNFNAFHNFYSAKGNYIAICEGDDIWMDAQKLQKQIEFLRSNSNFALAYHSFIQIDTSGKPIEEKDALDQPQEDIKGSELQLLKKHPLLCTICFKNFSPHLPKEMIEVLNVDSFLLSFLGNQGDAKYIHNINPALYRKHTGGIWSKKQKQLKYSFKVLLFTKLIQFYNGQDQTEVAKQFKKELINVRKMQIYNCFKSGDFYQGLKFAAKFPFGKSR